MTNEINKGDTVVVTTTGVVDEADSFRVRITNVHGTSAFVRNNHTFDVVKKADAYQPGKLYRDYAGDLFYRTNDPTDYWMGLVENGLVGWEAVPEFPLTEQRAVNVFIPPF